ncbi:hypothetical protein NM09_15200 [Vibrio caribbeanicus]|uniref:Uncharacterized protein n=1 Tax=Vibrio caribbeanicus TaxID=701175 RepID=A0ACC4NTI2_9VIBR|nr:hypothetical protein NM09_15200 [Vibrio caribbeanicus]
MLHINHSLSAPKPKPNRSDLAVNLLPERKMFENTNFINKKTTLIYQNDARTLIFEDCLFSN